jgi:antitoxin Phd
VSDCRGPGSARRKRGAWNLTEAKARFSELFDAALKVPQRVSRHGKHEVVVLSAGEYHRMTGAAKQRGTLVDFLAGLHFGDLDLDRNDAFGRDMEATPAPPA